jgi:hypothetical protein
MYQSRITSRCKHDKYYDKYINYDLYHDYYKDYYEDYLYISEMIIPLTIGSIRKGYTQVIKFLKILSIINRLRTCNLLS